MTVEFSLDGTRSWGSTADRSSRSPRRSRSRSSSATRAEVDYYWDALTAGGEESYCGWLKDKFGLSWQVIPAAFTNAMEHGDPAAQQRVMQAMLKMRRFDVAEIERAAAG